MNFATSSDPEYKEQGDAICWGLIVFAFFCLFIFLRATRIVP